MGRASRSLVGVVRELCLIGVVAVLAGCGHEQAPPNIILVSIDSLRADSLGSYGYHRDTSPFIDELAAAGVRFQNAISTSSWTLPAHAALLTGLYDTTHGLVTDDQRLTQDALTLAEVLRELGYHTAGFFGGPYLHPTFGLDQGFDVYRSCMTTSSDTASEEEIRQELLDKSHKSHADVTSPRTLEEVTKWADREADGPYFLFLHLWDVHYDYIPPPEYVELFDPDYTGDLTGVGFTDNPAITPQMPRRDLEHLVALYDGEIRFTDDYLRLIFEVLKGRGLLSNTLTVITSDHGEEFFEHGGKGHRRTLFDEMVRVPLIVHWPERLEAATREEQVRLIDLFPTLAVAAGHQGDFEIQGRDLGAVLRGWSLPAETALSEITSGGRTMRALRSNQHKVFQVDEGTPGALYDLEVDPQERRPLLLNSDREAERRRAEAMLRAEVAEALRLRSLLGLETSEPIELDEDLRQRLEALGYLDN